MATETRPLAVVTGASAGIGLELAKCCARNGFALLVADEATIHTAAAEFPDLGAAVDAVEADLSTITGVDQLYAALRAPTRRSIMGLRRSWIRSRLRCGMR